MGIPIGPIFTTLIVYNQITKPMRHQQTMFTSIPIFRALTILKCSNHHHTTTSASMAATPATTVCSAASPSIQDHVTVRAATISLQEWQAWGTDSPMPTQVAQIVEEMVDLERQSDAQMKFGGLGGKLKGDFKTQEDKKHRAKYKALDDSEQKLHFFSARQIACRLLGSRGYLCQKCWLPQEDCMCSRVVTSNLWHRIRFWLYMHPKDFLRQNNTGKLLWQVFGINAAKLCLFGIAEHEEIMWNAFSHSGRNNVWCLYPNKNTPTKSVEDSFAACTSNNLLSEPHQTDEGETFNFILIDGTWSNSAAMFRRLKERADLIWGDDLPCISLSTGASAMHKLRPQPSWDRTCTAGAAVGLLDELHLVSQFNSLGLDKQAEAVENSVDVLLASLTGRRLRMGRSITRRQRHHDDFC
ncbi:putative DTW domain-containing protein DTWD2/YfiP [Helianthus annuus]|nr:putative DTW domain-containing protein DTWD2/YfiP [Helianthus annuus]KAJ0632928.1 putative DTW domain-containing protein DTWD2/YfiP [Helianthus annuus]KAJ0636750.1 putative DTW domain-containing protein DTWD2/YfiP [Helianthus annuus]KAJ0826933.1 putative DTW domain-containing protein DTWD2/YfiP [Helianthus annuus]